MDKCEIMLIGKHIFRSWMQGEKTKLHGNKQVKKLKKRIEKTLALIETYCKKKIVFADSLLPFGTIREAYAHCTHAEEKSVRVQFCLPTKTMTT